MRARAGWSRRWKAATTSTGWPRAWRRIWTCWTPTPGNGGTDERHGREADRGDELRGGAEGAGGRGRGAGRRTGAAGALARPLRARRDAAQALRGPAEGGRAARREDRLRRQWRGVRHHALRSPVSEFRVHLTRVAVLAEYTIVRPVPLGAGLVRGVAWRSVALRPDHACDLERGPD